MVDAEKGKHALTTSKFNPVSNRALATAKLNFKRIKQIGFSLPSRYTKCDFWVGMESVFKSRERRWGLCYCRRQKQIQ